MNVLFNRSEIVHKASNLMSHPFAAPDDRLCISLLGPFAVHYNGAALDKFGYDKVRALFAFLVIESGKGPLNRDELGRLFWPDVSTETARGNLRRTLHELRQSLEAACPGQTFFIAGKNHIEFDRSSPYWLDIEQFAVPLPASDDSSAGVNDEIDRLARQLVLYRDDFLHEFKLRDAPLFGEWCDRQREMHKSQVLTLLQRLARCLAATGRTQPAIAMLRREISLESAAEDAHRRLMTLLAQCGRPSEALAQFESLRAQLRDELGIEPDPVTLSLARSIRRGELSPSGASHPMPSAERRQVCVLVCEMRADTALPAELAAEIVADSFGSWMDIINTHGGHGLALYADRALAYFGYPQAHEHAAIRVLEAALDLIHHAAVSGNLSVRLGAHSGWVVNDSRFKVPDATGQITQHASTLAAQTSWGQISVSPKLEQMVRGYFFLEGPLLSGDTDCYNLLARNAANNRLQAEAGRLTTFVGRAAELRVLRTAWENVRQGKAQALHISAEAGMGKSRLIQIHQAMVLQSGGACHLMRCQPEFKSTPYYPVVELLEQLLEQQTIEETADAMSTGDRLGHWLAAQGGQLDTHWPGLAELLHLPQDEPAFPLSRTERKRRIEAALHAVFQALARQRPMLLVVEDIHWADASTIEWLRATLGRPGTPFMLLYSARTGIEPLAGARILSLRPLLARQAEQLVRQASGDGALDAKVRASVVDRADGVPLYLEEMARALQTGLQDEIPGNLWNVLAVRLESVGEAKHLAQQAAVVGRRFGTELLAALWNGAAQALTQHLHKLVEAGLIQRDAHGDYFFRHALIQDSAYQALTSAERKRIHARLAQLYQGPFRHQTASSPERLARHLELAGEPIAAGLAWFEAGRLASERSANQEAVFHFESGIAQLRGRDDSGALELTLQAALGNTWIAMKGYGAEEAKTCFSRALELSRTTDDDSILFPVMWGLWLGGRSCTPEAFPLELTYKLDRIAQTSGKPEHTMQVQYAYGNNLFWMARHAEASEHLEQAIAVGHTLSSFDLVRTYGEDTGISAQSFLAWIHWLQGRPQTALATSEAAISAARALGHAQTLGFALAFAAILSRFMHQPHEANAFTTELLNLSQQHELLLWQAVAIGVGGWAAASLGQTEGLQRTEASVAAVRQAMSAVEGTFLAFHVDALYQLKQFETCAAQAQESIELCEARLDVYFVAEFWRLRGEALAQLQGCADEARHCLHQALDIAAQQGAQTLELRAAVALHRYQLEPDERIRLQQRMLAILATCPELSLGAEGHAANDQIVSPRT